jgi:tetratricopeptide (TPR) repeat protein
MRLREDRLTFRRRRDSPFFRLLALCALIVAALWLLVQVEDDKIRFTLFDPTPTVTRTANSYIQEAEAFFQAGNLEAAIEAYQDSLTVAPDNAVLMAEMARVMVYSSALKTSDAEKYERLQGALAVIERAAELAPRDSFVQAVRAFVLDWNANSNLIDAETREDYLFQAEQAAGIAVQLDAANPLAQIYFAEVQLDQQKWTAAQQTIETVLENDPRLMDAYRVHALVLETLGLYGDAIAEYQRAAELMPNMTFLYLRIGYNYRTLALNLGDPTLPAAKQYYEFALEYFAKAVAINEAIEVDDPIPYLAIAKTYAQQGEFFIAARNAERALELNPFDANTYGQLGIIYTQARNFETAMGVLKCATYGCAAAENEVGGVDVAGLPLSSLEVAFYYVQYGSILASLDFCDQAFPVLAEVEQAYGDNTVIAAIVAEDREICRLLAEGQ